MTTTDNWTILKLLKVSTDFLRDRGAEEPRLDAEVLLAKAKGCQRIQLYTDYHEEIDDDVRGAYREMIRLRAQGMPAAYLVGHKEFYSLSFQVSPDVLIPRPETELLVVELLEFADRLDKDREEILAADVGTGSGCIAVAAAKQSRRLRMYALDLSEDELVLAVKNALVHQVDDRVEFLQGDLLAPLPDDVELDFVISNPPYVTAAEMKELPRDVGEYEPHLALQGGPQGTDVIQRLVPQAADRLVSGGWLMMEISPEIAPLVLEIIAAEPRFDSAVARKDRAGLVRFIQARKRDA
ncbi:MAG: peptide chain release factor N(5)-glutamine methyltransferase [Planctomycetales bacterium]